ncbi:hypothetical protein HOLleu_38114 [Holothuria leucospilota]|uniref:Uncharacterized protein n=1 Tax=Holothuria leucospilota TaxID=206669 RepID=A0A9Q1BF07_HOLLE|nr:hypothetical protein HOLleu_38114 [Holothuria leucospilota]
MATYPSCPMCKAKHPREPDRVLKTFNFNDYPVTLPDGSEISFEEATTAYVETFFPDMDRKSYKVPAVFLYNHDDKVDHVPDDDVAMMSSERIKKGPVTEKKARSKIKTELHILEDRRQKDAVERVARTFYSWGSEQLGPMFVVSEFKFSNFLGNVNLRKEDKHEVITTDGEHDILIITKEYGVLFIQVKSVVGENYREKIRKAYGQILKDKLVFTTMNRDLSFISDVPMSGFVAVPNLTKEEIAGVEFCKSHQQVILTDNDLSEGLFKSWLASRFSKSGNTNIDKLSHDDDQLLRYKLLSSRYVGLASIVKLRTLSDGIKKVAGKVERIMLNPEQKECLKQTAKKMILMGDFGTGKSLLLMKKAEKVMKEVAINEGSVYVISFSVVSDGSGKVHDVTDNLVPYLQSINICKGEYSKNMVLTSFRDHLKFINKYIDKFPFKLTPEILCEVIKETHAIQGNCHFFLDEVPLCLGLCDSAWQSFERFCHEHESMFIWISIATCSFTLTDSIDFSNLNDYLPRTPFQKTILTRCMRTTRNSFKLLQAVREFNGDGLRKLTTCGNVVDGPRPLWLQIDRCLCGVGKDPYHCDCLAEVRLKSAFEKVLKRVEQVNRDGVTILLHGLHDTSTKMTKFLAEAARKACDAANINYRWKITSLTCDKSHKENEDDASKSAVTLVDLWSYKGNECKVVLFVDPFNGPVMWRVNTLWHGWVDISIASCRSLAQVIFITWPQEEHRLFLEDLKECMLEAGETAKDESINDFYKKLVNEITGGHNYHAEKPGGFMKFLLNKEVIERF